MTGWETLCRRTTSLRITEAARMMHLAADLTCHQVRRIVWSGREVRRSQHASAWMHLDGVGFAKVMVGRGELFVVEVEGVR